jgi:hypothetical protein
MRPHRQGNLINKRDIQVLVDSFFDNDPYYPQPNPTDELYAAFRSVYLDKCPYEFQSGATRFLSAIEARYSSSPSNCFGDSWPDSLDMAVQLPSSRPQLLQQDNRIAHT